MKSAGLLKFLLGLVVWLLLLLPLPALSQNPPPTDALSQPKVNLFNPSRDYSRPVFNFFKKIGFQVQSEFASRYVWNGLPYSEGPVWQPSASMEFHGFGVSVLGNFVLNDEPNQGQFNEVDFTAYYGITVKKLEIDVSFTLSIYPNDDPASLNFSEDSLNSNLHLAYPVGPLDLFTDLSIWIFGPEAGVFWDLGVGYQKNLPLKFSLSTSVLFGLSNGRYNEEFIGPDLGTGPNLFSYSLSFPWSPVKGLVLTPAFNVSTLLSSELRSAVRFPTNVWGGINIGYNF